ncbi:tetratricopeptide repeat protein [Maricaulis sp.]|uniref:tetratricopeptide repeat protein n=1 Tax=Maricaulis sp. TaxID=1486257 RepID=UPI003A94C14E
MRALIYLCLALLIASPAHAELRDLRARLAGQEGMVWIAFDGQPTLLRREVTAGGLDLVIEGISLQPRQITPHQRDLVSAIVIEPTEHGARIRLQGAQAWTGSEAELRQGGVLVRVHLTEGEASISPAMPAATYPSSNPDWRPTPAPAAPAQPARSASPAAPAPLTVAPPATPEPSHSVPAAPARASSMPAQAGATATAALPAELAACAAAAAAVEANPWDDGPLMQHARCLGRAGDSASAIRIYEQILAFEPENVTAALALADLRLQQGDREAARALYLRAASHATSDSEALRARSQAAALQPD